MNGVGVVMVIQLLYRIVAIGGYFKFERAVFVLDIYFRFRMLQLNL